jgi:valyl-tRNA synthetase
LCSVVDASTKSHEKQDFGEAGRLAYEFFWHDFADWYIEASKARLYSTNAFDKRTAQRILVYVLERTLRLWHPFMPYISEQLWQALPHAGPSLMTVAWPEAAGARCPVAEAHFEVLRLIVGAVRNARAEYKVEVSKKVEAVIVVEDRNVREAMRAEAGVLCLLAKIEPLSVQVRPSPGLHVSNVHPNHWVFMTVCWGCEPTNSRLVPRHVLCSTARCCNVLVGPVACCTFPV